MCMPVLTLSIIYFFCLHWQLGVKVFLVSLMFCVHNVLMFEQTWQQRCLKVPWSVWETPIVLHLKGRAAVVRQLYPGTGKNTYSTLWLVHDVSEGLAGSTPKNWSLCLLWDFIFVLSMYESKPLQIWILYTFRYSKYDMNMQRCDPPGAEQAIFHFMGPLNLSSNRFIIGKSGSACLNLTSQRVLRKGKRCLYFHTFCPCLYCIF